MKEYPQIIKDIKHKFKEWACSFSGCDGGDPQAPIWLCGIEWGYGKNRSETQEEYEQKVSQYYSTELPEEISKGAFTPSKSYLWKEGIKYPFGKSVAKLFMAINGLSVENYLELESKCKDTRLFKLNLYPVAFRSTSYDLWQKYSIGNLTGLESKDVYRTWCFINRFPAIADEVKKYKPKIILGVGVGYLTDFFTCFAGPRGSDSINVKQIQSKSSNGTVARTYYWSKINDGQTLLAVIPFFSSQYGLNSNDLLQEIGNDLFSLQKSLEVKVT